MRRALRLGAVSYLNAQPLIDGLESDERVVSIARAEPGALLELLFAGEIDCALAPVAAFVRDPSLVRTGRHGIGACGAVRTVLVRSRVPFADLATVQADPASRTSNLLAQIVLSQIAGRAVIVGEYAHAPARVIIGDAAFAPASSAADLEIDLAAAWMQQTGLPFVFACWIARDAAVAAAAAAVVDAAAVRGLARRPEIAREQASRVGITEAEAEDYLMNRIAYEITPEMERGLRRFLSEAAHSSSTR